MRASEAQALAALIARELERPADVQKTYEELAKAFQDDAPLIEFLSAKDRQHRTVFYLTSERAWFRGFGWTMAKALMLVGLGAAVVFYLGKGRLDPATGFSFFAFGACAYYMVLHVMGARRAAKSEEKSRAVLAEYQARLRDLRRTLPG